MYLGVTNKGKFRGVDIHKKIIEARSTKHEAQEKVSQTSSVWMGSFCRVPTSVKGPPRTVHSPSG
jgi:hypothetical protein